MALAFYEILKAGGFTTGGTNFDAKIRRQSLDPEDLLILSHVGGMDTCARKGSLEDAAARVTAEKLEPQPKSGRQERLENLWNRYV
jgi:xylose isomerase